MRKRISGNTGALALIALALTVIAALAVRCAQLQSYVSTESASLAQLQKRDALAAFDRFTLPPNRKLSVCNESAKEVTISALTAVYIDAHGNPATFNSASDQWRVWKIPAGSTRSLSLASSGSPAWDGSAVFFAMDIGSGNADQLVAGTSADLRSGCLRLPARITAEDN